MLSPGPAVELSAHPETHFVYSGRALMISGRGGWIRKGLHGYYVENTRFLSRAELRIGGKRPKPSGVSPVGHDGLLGYYVDPNEGAPYTRPIVITARHHLEEGLATVLQVSNHAQEQSYRFELTLHLEADFADIKEAEQGKRQQEAPVESSWNGERHELRFRYTHPDLDREVLIRIEHAPGVVWNEGALHFPLEVHARSSHELRLAFEPVLDGTSRTPQRWSFSPAGAPLAELRAGLRNDAPRLTSSNATVTNAWRTAVQDLASLPLGLADGPATPIAGLPAYHNLFGRDTLTAAWQALLAAPDLMRDTLRSNASRRGHRIDDPFDEEPGKLINRVHWGPLALLGENPFRHYYGDYATPMDFLIGTGQYLAWTNDRQTLRELLPAIRDVLEWTERYADIDGDGFVEYVARTDAPEEIRKQVKNQGWKDAPDAIRNEHGQVVENPIATCELQGYLYEGLRQTGQALLQLGERGYALELLRRARELKRRFNDAFWMEDEGFYVLGLGPDKQQIESITSNPGHLLATGIVPRARAGRVARRLMQPDLFSGWGIRTLSSEHPAFDPFSYHLGTVWPVENATIALGMARYGYWSEAQRVARGIFDASNLFVANRLPEAFGGVPRDEEHPHPGVYPQANEPQAWSASAVVLLIQTLLALRPVAPARTLLIDPHLPGWLPDLRLDGVRVGDATIDLRLWRDEDGGTHFESTAREGVALTVRQAPMKSATPLKHLREALPF